jgi:hypothetical protein
MTGCVWKRLANILEVRGVGYRSYRTSMPVAGEGYILPEGWGNEFGMRDIALVAIRHLTKRTIMSRFEGHDKLSMSDRGYEYPA